MKQIQGWVREIIDKSDKGIIERHLNGNKRKLQNARVSQQESHDSIAYFPHIILQDIKLSNQHLEVVGWAILEAIMMLRKQGRRQEQACVLDIGGKVGWEDVGQVE